MQHRPDKRIITTGFLSLVALVSVLALLAHTFLGVAAQEQMNPDPILMQFGIAVPQPSNLHNHLGGTGIAFAQSITPEKKSEVVVDPNLLFLKEHLSFPCTYTLTGVGDLTWKDLSNRFYDTEAYQDQLAYANPLLTEKDLTRGVKVTIPVPDPQFSAAALQSLLRTEQERIQLTPPLDLRTNTNPAQTTNQEDFSPDQLTITPEDFDLYTRVLACESGPNWDYKGLRMLAETITNRVRKYHKTFREILMQPGQYSVIDSGAYLQAIPSPLILQVARESLLGNLYLDPSVEFFCTQEAYEASTWFQSLRLVERYDNTVFLAQ